MLSTRLTTRYERLRRNQSGFTLGELLAVVVVIALLAAIALPIFINQQRVAVDASVKSDVRNTASSVSQWIANRPGVAAANTKVYTANPNGGKVVETNDHTVIGVFIKVNGEFTVCGFNDRGGKYEKAEHAWGFQSSTGSFAQVLSASCEGAVDADGRDISTTPTDPTFIGSDTLPAATQGDPYSTVIATSANPTPGFTLKSGSTLPLGLSLSQQGTLAGTPQATGDFEFTVVAKNFTGQRERKYKLTVGQASTVPSWGNTNVQLTDATQNSPYSTTLHANSYPDATYKVTVGDLPDGLTLNRITGELSGTPTKSGTSIFTVSAENSKAKSPLTFFLTVVSDTTAPVWTTDVNLPDGRENSAYTTTLHADGTPAPTYSFGSGNLPQGLTVDVNTGVLSGTPTESGTFVFTIKATNANSVTPLTFFLTLAPDTTAPTWTTNVSLPDGRENSAYTTTLNADGKPAPTYAVATGSTLPAGLSLNTTSGALSGTPSEPGSFIFTLNATNSNSTTPTTFFLKIVSETIAPAWTTNATLTDGRQNSAYTATLHASGKPTPTYEVATGSSLPAGLSLNATSGVLSGTPTDDGNFIFTINAVNADSTTPMSFFLTIAPDTTPPVWTSNISLPDARENSSYSATVTATGKPTPTYAVATGSSLPAGLSLNATTGAITGTPTVDGNFIFTLNAKNADSTTAQTFFLKVVADTSPPVWTSNVNLTDGRENSSYSTTVNATGKPTPTYAVAAGSSLPAGLSLNATSGVISGTPTEYGNFVFTLNAKNADSTTPLSFFLTIARDTTPPVWTSNINLPSGKQNNSYSTTVNASGKPTPTYAIKAGSSLPAGLSLNATTGAITGTPSGYGDFIFTLNAVNANSTTSQTFFLTFAQDTTPPVFSGTSVLPSGQVGESYSAQVAATGKPNPTFTAISGFPGISIAANGTLLGTPTQSGTYDVVITASNADSDVNRTFSVTVADAPSITLNTTSLTSGRRTFDYDSGNLSVSTARTTGTTSFNIAGLPSGLGFDSSTGRISGNPTVNGTFPLTITATNGKATDSKTVNLTIAAYLAMSLPSSRSVGSAGVQTSTTNTVGNNTTLIGFTVTGGTNAGATLSSTGLPSWVTVKMVSGNVSFTAGKSQSAGTFTFYLSVTDGHTSSGPIAYTFTIGQYQAFTASGSALQNYTGSFNSVTYDSTGARLSMTNSPTSFSAPITFVAGGKYTISMSISNTSQSSGSWTSSISGPNGDPGSSRTTTTGSTPANYTVDFTTNSASGTVYLNGFPYITPNNVRTYGWINTVTVTRTN